MERTWEAKLFPAPVNARDIHLNAVPFPKPSDLDGRIKPIWYESLVQKQQDVLRDKGIESEIRPYVVDPESPFEALYDGKEQLLWPGPTIGVRDVNEIHIELLEREISRAKFRAVTIDVWQMYYPYTKALSDPTIIAEYQRLSLPMPTPSLGVHTFLQTPDGYLTQTHRPIETNQYPGRLYAPGGQPLLTNSFIDDHQVEEILEEVLIQPNEYDPYFYMGGVILDREKMPRKPDLTGWVSIDLESGVIKERVDERERKARLDDELRKRKPKDVDGVVFAPSSEGGLMDYLTRYTHPEMFCPPSLGGLWVYGVHHFGEGWGQDALARMLYD